MAPGKDLTARKAQGYPENIDDSEQLAGLQEQVRLLSLDKAKLQNEKGALKLRCEGLLKDNDRLKSKIEELEERNNYLEHKNGTAQLQSPKKSISSASVATPQKLRSPVQQAPKAKINAPVNLQGTLPGIRFSC